MLLRIRLRPPGTTFFVFLTYTVTPPVFSALINTFSYECAFIDGCRAATSGLVLLSTGPSREIRPALNRSQHGDELFDATRRPLTLK